MCTCVACVLDTHVGMMQIADSFKSKIDETIRYFCVYKMFLLSDAPVYVEWSAFHDWHYLIMLSAVLITVRHYSSEVLFCLEFLPFMLKHGYTDSGPRLLHPDRFHKHPISSAAQHNNNKWPPFLHGAVNQKGCLFWGYSESSYQP